MRIQSWYVGAIAGICVGLLVSVPMTFMDWRLNPSALFHNEQGTDWNIVLETAFSWFWPVALPVLVVAVTVHSWKTSKR